MASILSLAIELIPFLPAHKRLEFAHKFTSIEEFATLHGRILLQECKDLRLTKNRSQAWSSWSGRETLESAQKLFEQLQKRHIGILDLTDQSYPALLKEIYDPPFMLYYRGTLPVQHLPQLAIVGTRKPSLNAKEETLLFTREVAPHLASVVSGLALGVDGHAHRAALASKAHTTAVLGGGFDHIYPASHKNLAARIIDEGGLLITEYAPSISPTEYTFPARNRIISGLTHGTIIIEAPHKSGSLITGQFALDQDRDLFVHAVGISDPTSGTAQMYEQGALALKRGDDLLSAWGIMPVSDKADASSPPKPTRMTNHGQYDIGKSIAADLWSELNNGDMDGFN
jgi:DNA processing protein